MGHSIALDVGWALFRAGTALQGSGVDVDVDIGQGLGGGGVGAFLTTLFVGAILVALAPEYTRARMADVVAEPVENAVYGLVILVGLVVLIVVLVLTIIGILVVIPLLVVAYLVWAVGSTIAFLAIADRLLEREDWLVLLLVAALINGGLVLTGIGGLVAFAVGAAGFGTVVRRWL